MSATLAARARSDATLSMPPRRASSGKRQPSAASRLMRWLGRRPGRALIILLFTAVAAAITRSIMLTQILAAARTRRRRGRQDLHAAGSPACKTH